jgi:hypothetical protein
MRLDHVSYVASHDQISDVVNRIGSQIGTAFIDGGIHPKFGTRNFTAPLLNGQYIEIVCPLDHPATDATPFGQAVKKKADAGGGWMAWILASSDIDTLENGLNKKAVEGLRKKPNGQILQWKQIGVTDMLDDARKPFYVQWLSNEHPSMDGLPHSKLAEIVINGEKSDEIKKILDNLTLDVNLTFISLPDLEVGIKEIIFEFDKKLISIN